MRSDFKLSGFEPVRLRRASKVLGESLDRLPRYGKRTPSETGSDETTDENRGPKGTFFERLKRFFRRILWSGSI